MTLKGWTPWFRSLLLIFGMVQDTGSVSYYCDIGASWLRALKGQPLDRLPGQGTCIGHHITR